MKPIIALYITPSLAILPVIWSLDAGSGGGGELDVGISVRSWRQNVTEAADWINKEPAD